MPEVLSVMGLGQEVASVVDRSVALLNGGQDRSLFRASQGPELPPPDLVLVPGEGKRETPR